MKCKECGCYLSPKEVEEIMTTVADGFRAERLCDQCYEYYEYEAMNYEPETHSDADPGL